MTEQSRTDSIGSLDLSRHAASQFPLSAAFLFALQGIRLRLGRMLLVFMGISLAMAFTGALLVTDVFYRHIPPEASGGAPAGQAGAFRWMWVAVALLISSSGTLNAILMSVTERIKEIGTLKCLGAKSIHIIEIFVFESALLGLLGGLVGGIVGYGFAIASFLLNIGSRFLSAAALAKGSEIILVCVGISMTLALLASVIPVLVAARIEPASAMRYEV